ncbi:flagellar assembly protein FliX [Dankookia sp. GCM10030260]|uniref:flagellar assembly protein FliX n=1 Tax=Dankookia sp. GCM10030260 TaxID=3273390 RepID=UPI00360E1B6B
MQQVGRIAAGGVAGPRRAGGGRPGFALAPPGAEAPAGTAATAAAGPVGLGLLALQEGDDRAARDQAAWRRAESILKELQALQRDLLHDGSDTKGLARLAALEMGEAGEDPLLRDAVEAVVLRAKVELARRGWNAAVSIP